MFFPGGTDGPGVVLNALVYAVTSGEGIVKVVGEVGSGKTMLCRMLEERLPDNVEIVYLANPSLSAKDIIYAIAFELDLDVDAGTERLLVMHKLQDYLVRKHSEGGTVVVFIEEAQGMPIETLEEIRLLSNLETHRHKLMQIILFGQPELDKNLQGKNIRQLRERITHSFYLEPMDLQQTSDYLQYRIQAAGCPWPKIFTSKAEKLIYRASRGLTRRVNILADKSLMAAYASSAIQPGHQYGAVQQKVLPKHVRAAIRDSGYGKRFLYPWPVLASSLLLVFAVVMGSFFFRPDRVTFPLVLVPQPESAVVADVSVPREPQAAPPQGAEVSEPEQVAVSEPAAPDPNVNQPVLPPEPFNVVQEEEAVALSEEAGLQSAAPGLPAEVSEPADTLTAIPEPERVEEQAETQVPQDFPSSEPVPELLALSETRAPQGQLETDTAAVQSLPEIEVTETDVNEPAPAAEAPASRSPFSELEGLIGLRARASGDWLQALSEKNGYTVQMASFPVSDDLLLEEYLQLLSLASLIDDTYLCLISATRTLPQNWLVIHGDFDGLSSARSYINSLPAYSRRYEPFVRNSRGVACLNNSASESLLAF